MKNRAAPEGTTLLQGLVYTKRFADINVSFRRIDEARIEVQITKLRTRADGIPLSMGVGHVIRTVTGEEYINGAVVLNDTGGYITTFSQKSRAIHTVRIYDDYHNEVNFITFCASPVTGEFFVVRDFDREDAEAASADTESNNEINTDLFYVSEGGIS